MAEYGVDPDPNRDVAPGAATGGGGYFGGGTPSLGGMTQYGTQLQGTWNPYDVIDPNPNWDTPSPAQTGRLDRRDGFGAPPDVAAGGPGQPPAPSSFSWRRALAPLIQFAPLPPPLKTAVRGGLALTDLMKPDLTDEQKNDIAVNAILDAVPGFRMAQGLGRLAQWGAKKAGIDYSGPSSLPGGGVNPDPTGAQKGTGGTDPFVQAQREQERSLYEHPLLRQFQPQLFAPRNEPNDSFARWTFRG